MKRKELRENNKYQKFKQVTQPVLHPIIQINSIDRSDANILYPQGFYLVSQAVETTTSKENTIHFSFVTLMLMIVVNSLFVLLCTTMVTLCREQLLSLQFINQQQLVCIGLPTRSEYFCLISVNTWDNIIFIEMYWIKTFLTLSDHKSHRSFCILVSTT